MQLQPIGDVISVRKILEPAAIMAIPTTRLRATATELRTLYSRMEKVFEDRKLEAATRLHTEFHLALVQYAPSRLHGVLLASMIKGAESAQLEIFRNHEAGAQSLAKHLPMVEALESDDVEGAAQAVADHLAPVFAYTHSLKGEQG